MTKLNYVLLVVVSTLLFACSENGTDEITPQTYNISGVVEKGPFVRGSTISIQPLNEKMQSLGTLYNTTIKNNAGEFSFGSQEFLMPYAELTADGYFFNEVKGELSAGILRLRSVVNLSNSSTINVNILTHLKYPRILNLISQGVTFDHANKQAQM
ncbi:MAG: RagB/SusD family nutrient uptake outer membrane protein, partial [Alistipes sp.]|nr:RagB/SusD family nutrient uptake outer membrane protein [Alistipes sp.]